MKTFRNAILCAVVPLACAIGATHAQAQGIGRSGMYGPWWDSPVTMSMDKLTAQQRNEVVQIKNKMMQMTMEHDQTMAKMEMEFMQSMMDLQKQLLDVFRGH
ncbi:hypothetical protein [Burkholderia sp. Ac-20365]|jgi:hypothetical protein|uniref:hypothetical protein n=1 Tax=Burkholderia sp. Ac-20365 TaxID=2703897 RepID=UPI00197BAFAA|nr:hypothetical protein [Burkholderia sp. Ac-20365]MBN3760635.1 hypothetical protein [Burkholderia sp. Ac-20365]